jgi:hypothetical protein
LYTSTIASEASRPKAKEVQTPVMPLSGVTMVPNPFVHADPVSALVAIAVRGSPVLFVPLLATKSWHLWILPPVETTNSITFEKPGRCSNRGGSGFRSKFPR